MFQDIGFLERFDAAARAGFKGVEFLFPYDHPPELVVERLHRNNLSLALFNTVAGDWAGGERGLAALPGREQEFRDGVDKSIIYAKATGCPLVHAMAGLWPEGQDIETGERVYIDNLRWAADRVAAAGLTAVIEPINTRDIPGYFTPSSSICLTRSDLQAGLAANTGQRAIRQRGSAGRKNTESVDLQSTEARDGDAGQRNLV
jgi:hydroxypyruvate isomerase